MAKVRVLECQNNIVNKETLRSIMKNTLALIDDVLTSTYGPFGSDTELISGDSQKTIYTDYSKDGKRVLNNIQFSNVIEASIVSQLIDITAHVEHEIGDGTTSAIKLSNAVFEFLCDIEEQNGIKPYQFARSLAKVIGEIQEKIKKRKREITLDDIYNISYVSTNGNAKIAQKMLDLYKEYGFNTYIDLNVSPIKDDMIRVYNGMTVNEGYGDPASVNEGAKCVLKSFIRNDHTKVTPRIYIFYDPIDTPEMINLMKRIISDNIAEPYSMNNRDVSYCIPTVILAPKITRDAMGYTSQLYDIMRSQKEQGKQMLPLLFVPNITNQELLSDIAIMSGASVINKFIDIKNQEAKIKEEEKILKQYNSDLADYYHGKTDIRPAKPKFDAATLNNVSEFFYGEAGVVSSDQHDTEFLELKNMYEVDENGNYIYDENKNIVYSTTYKTQISFLKESIENSILSGYDDDTIGRLKKRLRSMESNVVEYLVGGISIGDRNAAKDLIEDAIKNTRSASENGIGQAANVEGYLAALELQDEYNKAEKDDLSKSIIDGIVSSYKNIISCLYEQAYDKETVDEILNSIVDKKEAYNIMTNSFDGKVITAINTDIEILEAIGKIVSKMLTCNQVLLQSPNCNVYNM